MTKERVKEDLICEDLIQFNSSRVIKFALKAWEIYLEQYEGCWYGVKSDDYGIIVVGEYNPNDIELLEDALVSYKKVQEPVKVIKSLAHEKDSPRKITEKE